MYGSNNKYCLVQYPLVRYLGVSWYLLCIEVMCFWYVVMRCLCDGGEMVLVHWCKMSSEVVQCPQYGGEIVLVHCPLYALVLVQNVHNNIILEVNGVGTGVAWRFWR